MGVVILAFFVVRMQSVGNGLLFVGLILIKLGCKTDAGCLPVWGRIYLTDLLLIFPSYVPVSSLKYSNLVEQDLRTVHWLPVFLGDEYRLEKHLQIIVTWVDRRVTVMVATGWGLLCHFVRSWYCRVMDPSYVCL